MFKIQSNLILTCSSRYPLHSRLATSKTSLLPPYSLAQHPPSRQYAKISENKNSGSETIHWPEATASSAIPTPYEIFNQKKHSPYSKQRFYELVKLYHPDRHELNSIVARLSSETRLERYRLVIAANNILCDPVKRNAYDRYGAGWNGNPDLSQSGYTAPSSAFSGGRKYYGWSEELNQNATWEDWEKWYARDGAPQDPNFVSNAAFVGIILTFALLGGIGQATRASNSSFNFIEQRNALHNKVSMELMQIRKESTECNFQEERINRFMKSRDPVGCGTEVLKDESLRKLLESSDRCSQGNLEFQSRQYQSNDKSNTQDF